MFKLPVIKIKSKKKKTSKEDEEEEDVQKKSSIYIQIISANKSDTCSLKPFNRGCNLDNT